MKKKSGGQGRYIGKIINSLLDSDVRNDDLFFHNVELVAALVHETLDVAHHIPEGAQLTFDFAHVAIPLFDEGGIGVVRAHPAHRLLQEGLPQRVPLRMCAALSIRHLLTFSSNSSHNNNELDFYFPF
jgi:hypothetical protein